MTIFEIKTTKSTYYINCKSINQAIDHAVSIERDAIERNFKERPCMFSPPVYITPIEEVNERSRESAKELGRKMMEAERDRVSVISASVTKGKFINLEGE